MDLYQELILDHSKHPEHAGLREPYDAQTHHVNTTCGDEITLRVHVVGDGSAATVDDVSYDSIGCSISIASASVLAELVIGHSVADSLHAYDAMHGMLTSKGQDPGDEEIIGDGVAFSGVSKYPARVKCALLPWAAYTDALTQTGVDLSNTTRSEHDHG